MTAAAVAPSRFRCATETRQGHRAAAEVEDLIDDLVDRLDAVELERQDVPARTASTTNHLSKQGNHDELTITGSARLGGTLSVSREQGYYEAGQSAVVLRAGQVIGTFDQLDVPQGRPLLRFVVRTSGTQVRVTPEVKSFASVGTNRVERSVGSYMDTIVPGRGPDLDIVLGEFQQLSASEFDESFASLSPHQIDDNTTATIAAARESTRVVHQRMLALRTPSAPLPDIASTEPSDLPPVSGPPPGAEIAVDYWVSGLGQWGEAAERDGYGAFDFRTGGWMLGADAVLTEEFFVGASFGQAESDVDADHGFGSSDIDHDELFNVYGGYVGERYYIEQAFGFASNTTDTVRNIQVGPLISRRAISSYDSDSWSSYTEVGWRTTFLRWGAEPYFGMNYVRVLEDGFSETGAGSLNQTIRDRNTDSLQSELGVRLHTAYGTRFGSVVPRLTLGWNYDWAIDDRDIPTVWAGGRGTRFSLPGREIERSGLRVGGDLRFHSDVGYALSLSVNSEFRSGYRNTTAQLQLDWRF